MSVSQVVAPGSPERVSGTPSVLALPGASEELRVTLTQGLAAVNALLEKRIDEGPLGEAAATDSLRTWWAQRN